MQKLKHQLIYTMHSQKSGVLIPVHQECGETGHQRIKHWDSVQLQHFWRRIFLVVKYMEYNGLMEIIIVIM